MFRTTLQDLRHGARLLLGSPGFTIVAVAALAIGIGANTAIFAVVNTLLIQPLPYKDPDRLAIIWEHNIPRDRKNNVVSPGNYLHWREMNGVFAEMSVVSMTFRAAYTGDGEPEEVAQQIVNATLFPDPWSERRARSCLYAFRGSAAGQSRRPHQRSFLETPIRRRCQRHQSWHPSRRRSLYGGGRHAGRIFDSRQGRRRLDSCRVFRPNTHATRTMVDGHSQAEGRCDVSAGAGRHDPRRQPADAACFRISTPVGPRGWCL